jgi:hypothetical protein
MSRFSETTADNSTRIYLNEERHVMLAGEDDTDDEGTLLAENVEQLDELIGMLQRARAAMATKWFVRIVGTSMLAPFLSPMGARDIAAGGNVYADDREAHDFGSEDAARAWLDAHPQDSGLVVAYLPR